MKPLIWSLVNVHVHGRSHLEGMSGPYVAVANHSSHLDGPLLMSALPARMTRYLATGAAADYFYTSRTKALMPTLFMNTFPVERGGGASRHRGLSGNLLTDGVPLLLFPEGTRSRTGAMTTFKPGPAALSISRNVPVIPVALVGAHLAMPPEASVPRAGRPDVHVVIGAPMWSEKGEVARTFAARMHDQVLKMHDAMAQAVGLPLNEDYVRMAAEKKAAEAAEKAEKAAEVEARRAEKQAETEARRAARSEAAEAKRAEAQARRAHKARKADGLDGVAKESPRSGEDNQTDTDRKDTE